MFADVICVEDGVFRGLANAGAVGEDVSQSANEHAEISAEGFYAADGVRANLLEGKAAVFFLHENRNRQERLENLFHSDRTGSGTAAAVRGRKSFVQVEMHDIDAKIAGAGDAGEGVHVRAIHVEKRAFGVQDFGNFRHALFEDAERRGIGDHERRNVGRYEVAQFIDVNLAVRFGLDVFDFVAGDYRGGGIGSVGGIRD